MTRSPDSGTQRRRYAPRRPREERSAQIIDAAAQLLAEHGWRGMTMERVAAAAGVAKSVSYAIFGSQAGLQRAVMLRAQEVTQARVAKALAAAREADGFVAAFSTGLVVYLEHVVREPDISRLVLLPIEGAPASVHEAIRDGRERVLQQIEDVIEARIDREGAANVDAHLIAHLVRGNAELLARLLLEQPEKFTPERLANATAAFARYMPHS
ncbi:TetR/AcrR family transcriptional regulator [Streptomyces sp. N2-109]|uniref:TetR/AcrR family transcriptional regulator n=1 Tax=Streptomyces gossypii TaxID=2883101 RepID=A0ABT2JZJ1_9ACTN|nr:TetR/AcrR family transcriptional regulator [Streptomyces gossypii]MCT2593337.1 TetR/AcrR family transcriptional regulator [Streptomyces gossypii]